MTSPAPKDPHIDAVLNFAVDPFHSDKKENGNTAITGVSTGVLHPLGFGTVQKTFGNAQIAADHIYRVPQLQDVPRHRNWRSGINSPLQNEETGILHSGPPLNHVQPPFGQTQGLQSAPWSASASESATSSSLISYRESPLTPWDPNYFPPVEKNEQSTVRSLRTTASAFLQPREAPFFLTKRDEDQVQRSAGMPVNRGYSAVTPAALPSTRSSFHIHGLGVIKLSGNSPARLPANNLPFAFPAPQGNETGEAPYTMVSTAATSSTPLPSTEGPPDAKPFMPTLVPETRTSPPNRRLEASPGGAVASPLCTVASPLSNAEMASASTVQIAEDDAVHLPEKGAAHNEDKLSASPEPRKDGDTSVELSPVEIPVWEERFHHNCFKTQRLNKVVFEEVFEGAFDVLATLNPDQYRMPLGVSYIEMVKCGWNALLTLNRRV